MKPFLFALVLVLSILMAAVTPLALAGVSDPAPADLEQRCAAGGGCVYATRDAIRKLAGEAWDKGHAAGLQDCRVRSGSWTSGPIAN